MKERNPVEQQMGEIPALEAWALDLPLRVPPVSGTYVARADPSRVALRLDVDGPYPQMVASGTHSESFGRLNWIAKLNASGPDSWTGAIWYKRGDPIGFFFPHTNVEIRYSRSLGTLRATFSGGGVPNFVDSYRRSSFSFVQADFEFDFAQGLNPTTTVDTYAHPNRPATMPRENLSIQTVFERAGFNETKSPGGIVPLSGAGPNALWSNNELHDAMQTYWSRFDNTAQWAMWVFFAYLYEVGTGQGGIMFDEIGPNHRQGCAIFNGSDIFLPPAGDLNPAAWIQRMLFWAACHEMGHGFNLAHSFQKSWVWKGRSSWIPLSDEPEARSFMNYPDFVSGGQTAFFSDFEYRFSDSELLFLRHAPETFVQPGNAAFFDHHGFQQTNVSPEPAFKLELRVNRERAIFEFMEPATLELKLTNISSQVQLVDKNVLSMSDAMTLIFKKDRKPARQFVPYAKNCWLLEKKVLMPGESIYESLFVSAGLNGWDLAEPGNYTVQMALHLQDEDIVSNALRIRVTPPRGYDEEFLAQDFFSDEVGRILAFDGSRFLTTGNDILSEVANKLHDRRVSLHAYLALGSAKAQDYKQLVEDPKEPRKRLGIKIEPAQPEEARQLLTSALISQMAVAAESLGHIDCKWYVDRFSDWLARQGASEDAVKSQDTLYQTMSTRQVHGRPILDRVLQEIKTRRDSYKIKGK
jgi:hypothetical protein